MRDGCVGHMVGRKENSWTHRRCDFRLDYVFTWLVEPNFKGGGQVRGEQLRRLNDIIV